MKTKSSLFACLAGILLLGGGVIISAQDATDTNGASSSGDGTIDLHLFSDYEWHVNLGTEFPGAQGSFAVVDQDGAKVGKVSYDFSAGGLYVDGVGEVTLVDPASEFRIKVKSDNGQKIVVRFIDSTKQCLQYSLSYTDSGDWQLFKIDLTTKAPTHFGGTNDGTIHYPIKEVWLGAEKSPDQPKADVFFKDGVTLK